MEQKELLLEMSPQSAMGRRLAPGCLVLAASVLPASAQPFADIAEATAAKD